MELWTPKQVQSFLKVSLPYVYRLAERGQLPCVRIPSEGQGKRAKTVVRFLKTDVIDFVKSNYTGE
jgi:hypothetical protein